MLCLSFLTSSACASSFLFLSSLRNQSTRKKRAAATALRECSHTPFVLCVYLVPFGVELEQVCGQGRETRRWLW
jgi:hypothetical protein